MIWLEAPPTAPPSKVVTLAEGTTEDEEEEPVELA